MWAAQPSTPIFDNDDLLVSGIHDMLRPVQSRASSASGKPEERILWFSLPVFEYHDQHRHPGGDRIGTRGRSNLHEHFRRLLAGVIAEVVKKEFRTARRGAARQIPQDLVSEYVASTFVLVLKLVVGKENVFAAERNQ
jgi:hypothetical protein